MAPNFTLPDFGFHLTPATFPTDESNADYLNGKDGVWITDTRTGMKKWAPILRSTANANDQLTQADLNDLSWYMGNGATYRSTYKSYIEQGLAANVDEFGNVKIDKKEKVEYEHTELQKLKHEAKAKQKHKWKIGDHYLLKLKPTGDKPIIVFEYEIVKYIYTIGDTIFNSLIVRQIEGPICNKSTLSRNMCERLHVKYTSDLEIISMDMPLILKKTIKQEAQ